MIFQPQQIDNFLSLKLYNVKHIKKKLLFNISINYVSNTDPFFKMIFKFN